MLENMQPTEKVWPCKVRTVLDSLEKADALILAEALKNPAWSNESLSRELRQRGIPLIGQTIKRHRQNTCSCDRNA